LSNFLENTIKIISPMWAAKRLRAKKYISAVESFTGASYSRSATKNWQVAKGDPAYNTIKELSILRDRSEDLYRNNPLGSGAINTATTNVVGTSLKFHSQVNSKFLKIAPEKAEELESQIEHEFSTWCGNCDVAKMVNFDTYQDLVFRNALSTGESIILFLQQKEKNSDYGLRLQLVPSARLSNKDNLPDTNRMAGGIEKNGDGQPINYFIANQFPNTYYTNKASMKWQTVPAFNSKNGLKNIIHLFKIIYPGQNRGIPFLAPVVEKIKQIDRYVDAEIMAAVIQGMFTVFIESEVGENGIKAPGTDPNIGDISNSATGETELQMDYGAVLGLRPGEKPTFANPSRPNSQFEIFVTALTKQIGASLEIPFEVLMKSYNASYSASQASLLEAWRFFRSRRKWLSDYFCQEVFERWLYEAVAIGKIDAPGFFTSPAIRKAYSGAQWIGNPPGQIDPLKSITAAKERINLIVSTRAKEAAEFGEDFDKIILQREKEKRMLEASGLIEEPIASDNINSGVFNETN